MPIDARARLEDVLAAAADHARATGLSPMWAVTLLDGVNDCDADARALAELATRVRRRDRRHPPADLDHRVQHVRRRFIGPDRIGDTGRRGRPVPPLAAAREAAFRGVLADAGLASHRRYSGGADIAAACGQLVAGA